MHEADDGYKVHNLHYRSPRLILLITMVMASDHLKLLQDLTVTHSHSQVSTITLLKVMLILVSSLLVSRLLVS